ncbi:hypothetical protein [Paenibacillus sp. HJGM_3]|uniref:hypothetical protein n=1 Tax=Paenibacillus sp. HJGM_3 TaxID=3379816 RepID=UPI00385E517C
MAPTNSDKQHEVDWATWLSPDQHGPIAPPGWQELELRERQEDLQELTWFLSILDRRLQLYREAFPSEPFERELAAAFRQELDRLRQQVNRYMREPEACEIRDYLAVKYRIRTVYKQLGAVLEGSGWQAPAEQPGARPASDPTVEAGYIQREHGTYMRSYGSDYVKSYEADMARAFYPMSADCESRSVRFVTSSGMSALALALSAYRKHTGGWLPTYVQRGFYGEGVDLAQLLLQESTSRPQLVDADQIHALVEQGKAIGCLLVEPGLTWPVEPPVDLDRLMAQLERHPQTEPLYVIVDRTLTGIANPLFERYGDRLPPHIVLISVESGIKYYEYGLDLMSAGYIVATGKALKEPAAADAWVALLGLLNAGADPAMVRQLPVPDADRLQARLGRLNRNAWLVQSFLRHMQDQGFVWRADTSVHPSHAYQMGGMPWIGAVFYIQLREGMTEAAYQAWIDRLISEAPEELHLTAGGSFGFDTFRFNTVTDGSGTRNALRMSVGRDPIVQLLGKLRVLHRALTSELAADPSD